MKKVISRIMILLFAINAIGSKVFAAEALDPNTVRPMNTSAVSAVQQIAEEALFASQTQMYVIMGLLALVVIIVLGIAVVMGKQAKNEK